MRGALRIILTHQTALIRRMSAQATTNNNRGHPLGSTSHCERSEAIHGSAAARSADWATPRPPSQRVREALATRPVLELVGGPSRGEMVCFATLAMTGSVFVDIGQEVLPTTSTCFPRRRRFRRSPIPSCRRLDRAVDSLLRPHHSLGTPLASSSGIIYNRKTLDLGGEHGNARTS
jgi:hypothetical protein